MKTFKKFLESYEPVNEAEYNKEWWDSKSDSFKKRYIARHPNSIYAQASGMSNKQKDSVNKFVGQAFGKDSKAAKTAKANLSDTKTDKSSKETNKPKIDLSSMSKRDIQKKVISPDTTAEEIHDIVSQKKRNPNVLWAAAKNPNTSPDTLMMMGDSLLSYSDYNKSGDSWFDAVEEITSNEKVPDELIRKIENGNDRKAKFAMLFSPKASPDFLHDVLVHPEKHEAKSTWATRIYQNPNVRPEDKKLARKWLEDEDGFTEKNFEILDDAIKNNHRRDMWSPL